MGRSVYLYPASLCFALVLLFIRQLKIVTLELIYFRLRLIPSSCRCLVSTVGAGQRGLAVLFLGDFDDLDAIAHYPRSFSPWFNFFLDFWLEEASSDFTSVSGFTMYFF